MPEICDYCKKPLGKDYVITFTIKFYNSTAEWHFHYDCFFRDKRDKNEYAEYNRRTT